ncbi:MAG: sigma-70 family RNA polymerase sigma factor [Luteimonas sp.]|nr:sigma-70 family RNA polymerase sigma factor [Luteimonas sp.]
MSRDPQDVFSRRLDAHRGIMLKVAATYARNAHDRDDLAQEIATQLWRAWPGYDPQRNFSTWMYRIALNTAIDFVRGNARRIRHSIPLDEAEHDAPSTQPDHEAQASLRMLHRFIDTLEPLNRALLLLYLEERSTREMAEVLGISESNVTTKVSRLKQRIRDHVATD